MMRNRISFVIYLSFIFAIIIVECVFYDAKTIQSQDLFSPAMGFVHVGWIYFNSQRIINDNSFFKYTILGLIVFLACSIKQALMGFHGLSLFVAGLPLLFIAYFRSLTYLFYRNYPNMPKKPVIIFASPYGMVSFQGDHEGYIPKMKEKLFSMMIIIGFTIFIFGLVFLYRLILT